MAKNDGDGLRKWREAEAAYAQALAPFMSDQAEAPALRKRDLLELVQLRGRADRFREKYFREGPASNSD